MGSQALQKYSNRIIAENNNNEEIPNCPMTVIAPKRFYDFCALHSSIIKLSLASSQLMR